MNEQDYQLLSQYLDGELDELSASRLQQRLQAEPELKSTLNKLGEMDNRVKGAFEGQDQAPQRLIDMLRPTPSNVVAFPTRQPRPAWQYAIAASLVAAAGLLLMPNSQNSAPTGPTLASVLESTPSMASGWETLADGRDIRPVLSFRDIEGSWCREFLVADSGDGERGVACRENGNWHTQVLAAADIPGPSSEFRPAGAGDADVIADYLAQRAADIALSAQEEQALIAADWIE
jgi:hypothetical protein